MSLINGTTVEILNLEKIFVGYFAGSMQIFYFIAILVFGYLSAKYKMPTGVFLTLMTVFIIIMGAYYGEFFGLTIVCAGGYVLYRLRKTIIT